MLTSAFQFDDVIALVQRYTGLEFTLEIPKKKTSPATGGRRRRSSSSMIDDGGAGVEAYGGGGSGGGSNNTVYATPANIHDVLRSRRGWWGDDDAGKPNCAIDLMILLDASGSVASDFPTLRSFVRDVAKVPIPAPAPSAPSTCIYRCTCMRHGCFLVYANTCASYSNVVLRTLFTIQRIELKRIEIL